MPARATTGGPALTPEPAVDTPRLDAPEWSVPRDSTVVQRETRQFLPLPVQHRGRPYPASDLLVALTPRGQRPSASSFRPAAVEGAAAGVWLERLAVGAHDVYVRTATGAVLGAGRVHVL